MRNNLQSYPLKNKVIVVTGGAGVIGQHFVRAISAKGGIPVVADINFDAAQLVAKSCIGYAEAAHLDIVNKNSIIDLITDLLQRHGHIDALVNNAYPRNKSYGKNLEVVDYHDFCENLNMHLGGYFLVAQQFCLAFKRQGYGNIINMSSIYGSIAPRFEVYSGTSMTMPVEYAAIKSAVEHLTRYFAQYFKGAKIRVNCLSPGGILVDQPQSFLEAYKKYCGSKGMLEVDDILGGLIFLLSDESTFISGQNIIVDDGFSL